MKYDPKTPAGRAMLRILRYMLNELEGNYHEVVLIPAPDPQHSGHKIRAVQYQNAKWYQKFNQEYVSIRGIGKRRYARARTIIRRDQTIATLVRMIGGDFRGIQAERLVRFVESARAKRRLERRGLRDEARAIAAGEKQIPF